MRELYIRSVPATVILWAAKATIRTLTVILPQTSRAFVYGQLIESLDPVYQRNKLKFSVPGVLPWRRSYRLYAKEPETANWINTIPSGEVLWDIGANVGGYTVLAASHGVRVCAFEPEASNFAILQKNLDLNGLHDHVTALNLAISDQTGVTRFKLASAKVGSSGHAVNPDEGRVVLAYTGRELIETLGIAAPSYIKIDVDGYERHVIDGLDLSGVREIQVEVCDNGDAGYVFERLGSCGFQPNLSLAEAERGGAVNVLFSRRTLGKAAASSETLD
jgi:FkbM family methyltransferase